MKDDKKLILKVLVGSQAHGLASPDSDYDYRGVYVIPTEEILSLNYKYKGSHWMEGKEDQTSYEIGHFLSLAIKCNPTILEVFKAPVMDNYISLKIKGRKLGSSRIITEPELTDKEFEENYNVKFGDELRELFTYVWNPKDVFNAFVGYGLNQRKKMLSKDFERTSKYACAYIRTLINLINLLKNKDFSLVVSDEWKETLIEIRDKKWSNGKIIDLATQLTEEAEKELQKYIIEEKTQETNIDKINSFLFKIRKEFWD